MRPSDSPGNEKLSLKSTPLQFTGPSVAQAMPSKLVDTFFVIHDFWIFSSSYSSVNNLAPCEKARERSDFYTKHLHRRWRCALSPSDQSFLALIFFCFYVLFSNEHLSDFQVHFLSFSRNISVQLVWEG